MILELNTIKVAKMVAAVDPRFTAGYVLGHMSGLDVGISSKSQKSKKARLYRALQEAVKMAQKMMEDGLRRLKDLKEKPIKRIRVD